MFGFEIFQTFKMYTVWFPTFLNPSRNFVAIGTLILQLLINFTNWNIYIVYKISISIRSLYFFGAVA